MSCDYKMGQTMVNEKTYKDNAEFFRTVFEIGRRYKITNPGTNFLRKQSDPLKSFYRKNEKWIRKTIVLITRFSLPRNPKSIRYYNYINSLILIFFLYDFSKNFLLGFKLVQPIKTVYEVLTSNDLLEILEDPNIVLAIMEVSEDSSKSRDDIQVEVKQKELAIDYLSKKYAKVPLEIPPTTLFFHLHSNTIPIITFPIFLQILS